MRNFEQKHTLLTNVFYTSVTEDFMPTKIDQYNTYTSMQKNELE